MTRWCLALALAVIGCSSDEEGTGAGERHDAGVGGTRGSAGVSSGATGGGSGTSGGADGGAGSGCGRSERRCGSRLGPCLLAHGFGSDHDERRRPSSSFEVVELDEVDFTPRAALSVSLCWER